MISKLVARFYLVMSVLILVTSSCFSIITLPGGGDDPSSRVEPVVAFTNVTEDVGLSGVRGDSFAWGDYNNDGYQDLLVKGARLFRNNGPPAWDFTEVTKLVGLDSSGYAVWGDYNNDGYLDKLHPHAPRIPALPTTPSSVWTRSAATTARRAGRSPTQQPRPAAQTTATRRWRPAGAITTVTATWTSMWSTGEI